MRKHKNKKPVREDYDFIPFPEEVYVPAENNDKAYSGYIIYSLSNETKLTIGNGEDGIFTINGKTVIPGSSIRGRIRSNAEILSCAYPRFVSDTATHKFKNKKKWITRNKDPKKELERKYKTKFGTDAVTSLFGYVSADVDLDKQDNTNKKGKVFFLDAKICTNFKLESKYVQLLEPHPAARKYYDVNDNEPKGYKYYFLIKVENNKKIIKSQELTYKKVELLKKDQVFEGKILFDNLSDFELGLLLCSTQYKNSLYDSIGMGKSLGYGRIKFNKIDLYLDDENRFKCLVNKPQDRTGEVENFKNTFKEKMKKHPGYDIVVKNYLKSKKFKSVSIKNSK